MRLYDKVIVLLEMLATWFWMLVARILFFPALLRMTITEKRWYSRIDSTIIVGALPLRKHMKKLVEKEKVRVVLSLNEKYELMCFTPSEEGPSTKYRTAMKSANSVVYDVMVDSQAESKSEVHTIPGIAQSDFFIASHVEWNDLGVQWFWFSAVDFKYPSLEDIGRCLQIIQDCKRRKETIYVHCKSGKGRSVVVAACYLMKECDYTPEKATDYIRSRRPQINMNPRQYNMVKIYYEEFRSKKNI